MSLRLTPAATQYVDELVKREGRCRKGEDPIADDSGATGRKRNPSRIARALRISVEFIDKMRGVQRVEERLARRLIEELNGNWELFKAMCKR